MSVTVSQTAGCSCILKGLNHSFAPGKQHRKGSKLSIHFTRITCHSVFGIQQKNLESLYTDLRNPFLNLHNFTRKKHQLFTSPQYMP